MRATWLNINRNDRRSSAVVDLEAAIGWSSRANHVVTFRLGVPFVFGSSTCQAVGNPSLKAIWAVPSVPVAVRAVVVPAWESSSSQTCDWVLGSAPFGLYAQRPGEIFNGWFRDTSPATRLDASTHFERNGIEAQLALGFGQTT